MRVSILIVALFGLFAVCQSAIVIPRLESRVDLEALKKIIEDALQSGLAEICKYISNPLTNYIKISTCLWFWIVPGKRDVQHKRIIQFFKDLHNDVLFPTINNLAQSLAGMGSHLFAGLAENGIGKREIEDSIDALAEELVATYASGT